MYPAVIRTCLDGRFQTDDVTLTFDDHDTWASDMNTPEIPLPVGDDGVWMEILNRPKPSFPQPTLFLDRDGVIVEEVNYLHKAEDTKLIDGAADTIRRANLAGIPVAVVTNQAGIGYGMYGWEEFAIVQERMLDALSDADAFVNAVVACPFHAKGKPPYNHPNHPCRKPNPGMLLKAAEHMAIDLGRSWIVGDRAGDLEAGKNAGLAGGIHVLTGHGGDPSERTSSVALGGRQYTVLAASSIDDVTAHVPLFGV